jgi:ATPase subunit of ABC transporter with duplicated ATPase domains
MGHLDVSRVSYQLGDGRLLLDDVSFRVGEGTKAALVGPNGTGKTTLLRLLAGDIEPLSGAVTRSGGVGVMRQFVARATGHADDADDADAESDRPTVHGLLVSAAAPHIQAAARELDAAELDMMTRDDEPAQLRYAQALADWGDAGGYQAETLWDTCCTEALGVSYSAVRYRDAATLSGGEQKRLVLEALLRGPDQVLLLDEPDNFLDVPAKRWLEDALLASPKTVLYVTHDRELLARTAQRLIVLEDTPGGNTVWVHGGGYASFHEARQARNDRFDELRRRWDEEHEKLKELVRNLQRAATMSDVMAKRYAAAQTRLRKFEEAGPPQERPRDQRVSMRLRGGRTGVRALECQNLELTGLTRPFDLEVFYGDRVAVLGPNGTGKSHFLRLLASLAQPEDDETSRSLTPRVEPVAHSGGARLGARVVPGYFRQFQEFGSAATRPAGAPDPNLTTLVDLLEVEFAAQRGAAMSALRRYELNHQADQRYGTLSGGQQARFQILRLELAGATMLLLDEPTDNLDLLSAEALEEGLNAFDGTVLAVTHDRWFSRGFDRFVVFGADGRVYEADEPVWDASKTSLGSRPVSRLAGG